jgi:hypothetical protein
MWICRRTCWRKTTAHKVLQDGLWWDMLFKDTKEYARSCDTYQRVGNPLEINYPFIQLDHFRNLRNGLLTLLDRSTHWLSIRRTDTSLPNKLPHEMGQSRGSSIFFDKYNY